MILFEQLDRAGRRDREHLRIPAGQWCLSRIVSDLPCVRDVFVESPEGRVRATGRLISVSCHGEARCAPNLAESNYPAAHCVNRVQRCVTCPGCPARQPANWGNDDRTDATTTDRATALLRPRLPGRLRLPSATTAT